MIDTLANVAGLLNSRKCSLTGTVTPLGSCNVNFLWVKQWNWAVTGVLTFQAHSRSQSCNAAQLFQYPLMIFFPLDYSRGSVSIWLWIPFSGAATQTVNKTHGIFAPVSSSVSQHIWRALASKEEPWEQCFHEHTLQKGWVRHLRMIPGKEAKQISLWVLHK